MIRKTASWTALVVTCRTALYRKALQEELEFKQKLNVLPKDLLILCIEDPVNDSGSGGATLNALLIVTEHLSLKAGYTVVTSDVLKDARILVMHMGRYFPYDPCTRGFVCLPVVSSNGELDGLIDNFDALFYSVSLNFAPNSPPGLWVCSSDMTLTCPEKCQINWDELDLNNGVLCIATQASKSYARKHGSCKIEEDGTLVDIIFQGTPDEIQQCSMGDGKVSVISGVVFFSTYAAEKLLATHVTPSLSACTYMGVDSGMKPLGLSIFFDILLSMTSGVTKDDYISGRRSGSYGKPAVRDSSSNMSYARETLWKSMHSIKLQGYVVKGGAHRYLDSADSPSSFCFNLSNYKLNINGIEWSDRVHSFVHEKSIVGHKVMLINTFLDEGVSIGEGCTLIHCDLLKNVIVGSNCFLHGLDRQSCQSILNGRIPDNTTLIGLSANFPITNMERFFVSMLNKKCKGEKCDLNALNIDDCTGSYNEGFPSRPFNSRKEFENLNSSDANNEFSDVLPQRKALEDSFMTKKIFPVFHPERRPNVQNSLDLLQEDPSKDLTAFWKECCKVSCCELLKNVNIGYEFQLRKSLYLSIAKKKIQGTLAKNLNISILPYLKMFVATGQYNHVLNLLDEIAIGVIKHGDIAKSRPDICARVFACISDTLGYMADEKAGLRSGPAANKEWILPLQLLESDDIKSGILALAKLRDNWLNSADRIIRAARHYEKAEQILIKHAVFGDFSSIRTTDIPVLTKNVWYMAECPARVDIAGAWTDTPPVCYEHGGSVTNIAVLLNGKRPIGARVRIIDKPIVLLTLRGSDENSTQYIECSTLEDFNDYSHPRALGSLLKTCIVLCRIVHLDSNETLENQLLSKFKGGFELETWSRLPQGSGLGTSSILAGGILAVLMRASGKLVSVDSLIHAVLMVEQMLTTGGGWQDQVGGLVGGIKTGRSEIGMPLRVTFEPIPISDEFRNIFLSHLKLIYTGKTRLARNILQNVLRNWYTKRTDIMDNCRNIRDTAERCGQAFKDEDLKAIGRCLEESWDEKRLMATGCEPDVCARMMAKLRPHCLGMALGGAGGGGFLYLITKEPSTNDVIMGLLRDVEGAETATAYDVTIDMVGMVCTKTAIS